jgi:cupin fold WbuC family metalloprotein
MSYPLALPVPSGSFVTLSDDLLDRVIQASRESPRGRIVMPFHGEANAVLQRMLNAVQPGSYVRPHEHGAPPKDEAIVVMRGAMRYFIFERDGSIRHAVDLSAGGPDYGLEIRAGTFHCFVATEPDTIIYECKTGPYDKATDKQFAPWAPEEGSDEAEAYVARLMAHPV